MIPADFKSQLNEFVSFKSVSTDGSFLPEIESLVKWLTSLFEKNKFRVEVFKGKTCNPVVFASLEVSPKLPTVLVYGHYDVQPADQNDGWDRDPFSLDEKNGKLIARGVVDNKGQILTHIYTAIKLHKEGKLKFNVKFLIEGNEETSNDDLAEIINKNKNKLSCDVVLISDGEIPYKPTIEYSLRGGFNVLVRFKTAKNNQHSGIYGGAIPNASYELSKLLGKLFDSNNKVQIPGFYDGVDKITKTQLNSNKKLLKVNPNILGHIGAKKMVCEKGLDFYTQTGLRPTLQVTGVKTGYIGEGFANIVPAIAEARLNCRIVTSQNPMKIYNAIEKFVKRSVPSYVDVEMSFSGMHNPVKINTDSKWFKIVNSILKTVYGEEPLLKAVGGAIPVVSDFKEILKADTLLVSLGNEDCNMHGVSENFDLGLLQKGLEFSEEFLCSMNS